MRNYLIFLLLLPLLLAFQPAASTESPEEVLEQIGAVYADATFLYQEVDYQLWRSSQATAPYSKESGRYIKNKSQIYAEVGPVKSLTTPDFIISVDESEKTLLLSNNNRTREPQPLDDLIGELPEGSEMSLSKPAADMGLLQIRTAYGEVSEAHFYYDASNYLLKKVVLQYRREINLSEGQVEDFAQPVLEIIYQKNELRKAETPLTEITHYLIQRSGKWQLAPTYRQYTLINNLNPESN